MSRSAGLLRLFTLSHFKNQSVADDGFGCPETMAKKQKPQLETKKAPSGI